MSATPATMLQIVAGGLQDRERLNSSEGNPSVAFYKSVMRRRTRWASQWRRVEFDGIADFGRTAICTLPIQGELITRATLVIDLPDILTPQANAINYYEFNTKDNHIIGPSWAWTNGLGHAICSDVQMLIGDEIIDRFDSRVLEVLDEQTRPVEHFDSTDLLIARDPSTFTDRQMTVPNVPLVPQTNPQTLEVVFPFWWNRGPGPQALPIQALWKDKVQLKVTFRPVQECVYTSTRVDPRNPPLSANQGGPMPNIANCGFFVYDASSTEMIYNAASTADLAGYSNPFPGKVIDANTQPPAAAFTMPSAYHFTDAYWIIEYVSLEDREASAYRMADLEIPIEQHVPMPVVTTGGSENIRIRMDQAGLVRDLTWVAQRVEATDYNAYFLFSKDLGDPAGPPTLLGPTPLAPQQNPCDIPWWPNAQIPNWDYGDGYIRPAFVDRRSDPIASAKMQYRGLSRFEHEAPSTFRSLIPALNCKRGPLIDRYIYRYDFGFWPTGGLAETLTLPVDEIRGFSNWDKMPKRELALTMYQDRCSNSEWVVDVSQNPLSISGSSYTNVDALFDSATAGFIVRLVGALPNNSDNNGNGATVLGIVDFNQLRRQKGYIGLFIRTNEQGSASLVLQTTAGYTWLAVAGAGGYGLLENGRGGTAGSAVEISWQGGNLTKTHKAVVLAEGKVAYSNRGNNSLLLNGDIFDSPIFNVIYYSVVTSIQVKINTENSDAAISLVINGIPHGTTYDIPKRTGLFTCIFQNAPLPANTATTLYFLLTDPAILQVADNFYIELTSANTIVAEVYNSKLTCVIVAQNLVMGLGETGPIYGGGGGGRGADAGIGEFDGLTMPTTAGFVTSHQQTGGTTYTYHGGDGYYGGGSGTLGGGGGGSYVSEFLQQVNTFENIEATPVSAVLTPLRLVPTSQPNFNIYSWITRYNRLRINSGRGSIMFNDAA